MNVTRGLVLVCLIALGVVLVRTFAQAADPFSSVPSTLNSPARNVSAVSPNDSTDLPTTSRALLVSDSASVKVTTAGGDTVVLPLVKGFNPICVQRVWSTGTDSGISIYACY